MHSLSSTLVDSIHHTDGVDCQLKFVPAVVRQLPPAHSVAGGGTPGAYGGQYGIPTTSS
ncbi:MAG: hypothetical protein IKK79_06960 [Spirochaetaceae bacterium]|nr:hypothetical protein [Spirochaetaceae bacterium]